MKKVLLYLIKYYQTHQPDRLKSMCIYEPSCSEYAKQAILKYGALEGFAKGINRIRRCNNKHEGGVDLP